MRIAMISTSYVSVPPRHYGGTELVVYELVDGLLQNGHELTLFATGDSRTTAELRSLYPLAQWPPDPLTDLNHVTWAMARALEGDFDVIHAHSAVALAASRFAPYVPLVYTIHHERSERLSGFYRWFQDAYYIAISEDQRRREVALRNCAVIHHGLDPAKYECVSTPSDYVCFVGRLARVKGPHTAIDAAQRAGRRIVIAGEIHQADSAFGEREVYPRLRLPDVSFLGSIGMSVKVPLLRDALALLAPVEWNEPFGLILVEAMLSGCPVVGFPLGSLPELIEEGVTGFIVRSPAEMSTLISAAGPLADFDRKRCHEQAAQRFGRQRMVLEHERFYEAAAEHRPIIVPPELRRIA